MSKDIVGGIILGCTGVLWGTIAVLVYRIGDVGLSATAMMFAVMILMLAFQDIKGD